MANAPLLSAAFTGRAADLAWLRQVVGGRDPGIAVVHGLGGVGKSSLVLKYLSERQFRGRTVWWLPADSSQAIEQNLAQAARQLGVGPQEATASELASAALGWLVVRGDFVVVLDNVGHVKDILPVLQVLQAAKRPRVIVTTRLASGWTAAGMVTRELGVLSGAEALGVLIVTAGRSLAQLIPGLANLVEELGRLPLALEQAGAYLREMPHLTPQDLLDSLREAPDPGIGRTGFESDGERTISRIWRVTLDRLAVTHPEAVDLLRVVAWLSPDGIPLRVLTTVVRTETGLQALAGLSMISLGQDLVLVHRLVQTVARTPDPADPHRLPDDIDAARQRAARLLADAMPDVDDPQLWAWVRALLPSIEAYARHADPDTDDQAVSLLLDRAAAFLRGQGDLVTATAWFERALQARERILGAEHPDTLTTRNNLAHAYESAGDPRLAIPLFEKTLADSEQVLGRDHPATLTARSNLAYGYLSGGDLERAIPLHEETLADSERVLGSDHPDTLTLRNNLAYGYRSNGDLERAIPLYEKALADFERVLGATHPRTLASRDDLAGAFVSAGDLGRAIPMYEKAFADRERVLGTDHPDTLTSRNNLAGACRLAGDLGRAIPLHVKALAGAERVLGMDHPHTLVLRMTLALAYLAAGRYGEAVSLSVMNARESARVFGEDDRRTLDLVDKEAYCRLASGDQVRAIRLLTDLLRRCEEALGIDDDLTAKVRNRLAKALGA